MSLIIRYIILPALIILNLISILLIYLGWKGKRVIAARGGIQKMYAKLFDAIKEMPESHISYGDNVTATATYQNYSNRHCKLKIYASKNLTEVKFYILYNSKWVKTEKKNYYGVFSDGDILFKIILDFPDCDLSYKSSPL